MLDMELNEHSHFGASQQPQSTPIEQRRIANTSNKYTIQIGPQSQPSTSVSSHGTTWNACADTSIEEDSVSPIRSLLLHIYLDHSILRC